MALTDLGTCPTREHTQHPQCGYIGCVDLRIWAKAHRYKWRFEESYKAEDNMHVRGDGRWFVEVLCQRGLIYPKGGDEILAFTSSTDAWRALLEIGVKPKRIDAKEREGVFPIELLDQVAAILRPRKRRTVISTPEQVETRRETLKRAREARKTLSPERENQSISHDQPGLKLGQG